MKAISASIIVLAAVILILGGAHINTDTGLFVEVLGCGVGLCGLIGWFLILKDKQT